MKRKKKIKGRKITPEQQQKRLDWELINQEGPIYLDKKVLKKQPKEYIEALIKGF